MEIIFSETCRHYFVSRSPPTTWWSWRKPRSEPLPPRFTLPPGAWQKLLCQVNIPAPARKWNDLVLKILHKALPLGYKLKHTDRTLDKCPSCGTPNETHEHLFLTCPQAVLLRTQSDLLLGRLHLPPSAPESLATLLLPSAAHGSKNSRKKKAALQYVIIRGALYALWTH